jgi:hypothetical protein
MADNFRKRRMIYGWLGYLYKKGKRLLKVIESQKHRNKALTTKSLFVLYKNAKMNRRINRLKFNFIGRKVSKTILSLVHELLVCQVQEKTNA